MIARLNAAHACSYLDHHRAAFMAQHGGKNTLGVFTG